MRTDPHGCLIFGIGHERRQILTLPAWDVLLRLNGQDVAEEPPTSSSGASFSNQCLRAGSAWEKVSLYSSGGGSRSRTTEGPPMAYPQTRRAKGRCEHPHLRQHGELPSTQAGNRATADRPASSICRRTDAWIYPW